MSLPIGIFDSGAGGLTVLDALYRRLPEESFLYLGDTARLPYGTKSQATVCRYALQSSRLLIKRGIKALIVADNTSSSHALDLLQSELPQIPVFGVVQPGIRAALQATRNGKIAILATEGVVETDLYTKDLQQINPQIQTTSAACSLLVSLVEENLVKGVLVEKIIRHILNSLSGNWDTLLLGCTHLPPLQRIIRQIVGSEITVIDSAQTTAINVTKHLKKMKLLEVKQQDKKRNRADIHCLVTDMPETFIRLAPIFLHNLPLQRDKVSSVKLEPPHE